MDRIQWREYGFGDIIHFQFYDCCANRDPIMKSVAFIVPYSNLDTIPTLIGLVQGLAEKDILIDIYYCPIPSASHFVKPIKNVYLFEVKYNSHRGSVARFDEVKSWCRQVVTQGYERHYDILFGVDANGLVAASWAALKLKRPFAYFSLELLFLTDQWRMSAFVLKALESFVIRYAKGVLIQDATRAEMLFKSCFTSPRPFVELPNAWRGSSYAGKSNLLHNKLGINSDRIIVLHIGSCLPWTCLAEIAEAACSWDTALALVIQTRGVLGESLYERRVSAAINNRNVYLLDKPCPSETFLHLVASADIGLCFYNDQKHANSIDKNISYVGKSSGKFSTYLQAGVSVITNQIGGVSPYVEKYGCGLVVTSPQEVESAVRRIVADKANYSYRATACFETEFSSDRYESPAIDRICSWLQ